MSGFEFDYTCPIIDKNIEFIKKIFEKNIKYVIRDLSPKFAETNESKAYIENTAEDLYNDIENEIERVRTTNEDMRDEAEKQIAKLENKIESLSKKKSK